MKAQIKASLELGPVLPGTLEERYNVCGKAGCRCKDKINPRKHGPYYHLSYSLKGRNSTVFVRRDDAATVREMTENYRKARSNTQELALATVETFRKKGLEKTLNEYARLTNEESCGKTGAALGSGMLRKLRVSRNKWKAKALSRRSDLEKQRVRIRDVDQSRKKWKTKAVKAQKKNKVLQKKLKDANKKISQTAQKDESKKNSTEQRRRVD